MLALLATEGLHPGDHARLARLREQMFEVDVRYSALVPEGIFAELDRCGMRGHRMVNERQVERACRTPPETGRARHRGELITALDGDRVRYQGNWQMLRDLESGRYVDLSDPLARRKPPWCVGLAAPAAGKLASHQHAVNRGVHGIVDTPS